VAPPARNNHADVTAVSKQIRLALFLENRLDLGVHGIMQTERLVPLVLVGLMIAIGVVMVIALIWPELMPFFRT
jgi:hypothetical protein